LKPWVIAGLLSLLFPGLGQIYNRQTNKGLIAMCLQFVFILVGILTMGFLGAPAVILWIWGIVDAIINAQKRDRQNMKQPSASKGKSLYVELGIGAVIAIVLVFLVWKIGTGIYCAPHPDKKAVKEDALEYLTEKYEQEFEITKVKFSCYPSNAFEIKAYSLNNPDVTITMHAPSTGDEFSDDYIHKLWDKESKEELKPLVEKFYPESPPFRADIIIINRDAIDKLQKSTKVPSLKQARKHYINEMILSFELVLFKELTQENKQIEMKKVFDLIQQLKETGIPIIGITISYYNPKLEKKGEKVLEEYHTHKFWDELQYSLDIEAEDIPSIQTPEDVTKYLIKIND
jgi:TM2 domain-containing membrane protein YozV